MQSDEFFVYILKNLKGKYYVGHTDNLERRLRQHNDTKDNKHLGKYTHKNGPWRLVYFENYSNRSDAVMRERQIKGWKSSIMIHNLIATSRVPISQKNSSNVKLNH